LMNVESVTARFERANPLLGREIKMARYGYYDDSDGGWAPYVPVAERRKKAAKKVADLQKKGRKISPVHIEGKTIARTFWGKSWCDNLEAYSDFENRLPRGRTYVRNGSVVDLQISKGTITAMVSGSEMYDVKISIKALEQPRWKSLIEKCSGQIDSLVELLQGRFSKGVMEIITSKDHGLFPSPKSISLDCSCPDGAVMCKHVAAVLYGVGARLDKQPELFFELRNVDHAELISAAASKNTVRRTASTERVLKTADLSGLFGIDLQEERQAEKPSTKVGSKAAAKKTAKKTMKATNKTSRNTKAT